MKPAPDLELRSEEVQEIMTFVPHWMISWGLTLILGVVVGLLALSWFVKYPEVIQGKVMITTQQPPVKVVAKVSGSIEKLYAIDGNTVSAGQNLAVIENPISLESVSFLNAFSQEVNLFLAGKRREINFAGTDMTFGEIQDEYNSIVKTIKDYKDFLSESHYARQQETFKSQIGFQKTLKKITIGLLELSENELIIGKEKHEIQESLYEEGVISKIVFYKEKEAYTQKKQEVEGIRKTIVQADITIGGIEKQLYDLQFEQKEKERNFKDKIRQSLRSIDNHLNNWQQSYVVSAPIDGKLSYLEQLSENKYIKSDQELFAVIPGDQNYIGILDIPSRGFGKIKKGQRVLIGLNNYPSYEYGKLEGIIMNISMLPNEDKYRVSVMLEKGMETQYHRNLVFKPEMKGIANIITDDLRLTERVLYQFRSMFSRTKEIIEEKKPEAITDKSK